MVGCYHIFELSLCDENDHCNCYGGALQPFERDVCQKQEKNRSAAMLT